MLRRMEPTFGTLIRRAREQKKLLAREVAARLEIDPGTLSRLETGSYKETPSPDLIRRISAVLEVPAQQLMEALGYGILEEGRSYDPTLYLMLESISTWPEGQRELLWLYISAVDNALATHDDDLDAERVS